MTAQQVATLIAAEVGGLTETVVTAFSSYIVSTGGSVVSTAALQAGRLNTTVFNPGYWPEMGWSRDALSTAVPELACIDVIILPLATRAKSLLVADMESTIIGEEMLDEMAERIGCRDKVAEITRRAMNNELDFIESLNTRVKLFAGQSVQFLTEMAGRITWSPGARVLVHGLNSIGGHAWLVSGGFTYFAKIVAEAIGFNDYFANELEIENGRLTGAVHKPILGREAKLQIFEQALAKYQLPVSRSLAIGDGSNDLDMLSACQRGGGLAIAYRAKPAVRAAISNQLNVGRLDDLLYVMGF